MDDESCCPLKESNPCGNVLICEKFDCKRLNGSIGYVLYIMQKNSDHDF